MARLFERFNDFLIGVNTRRASIARRINVILLGLLQLGGGLILYNTDYTRGTPLAIEQSGLISMPVFSLVMAFAGLITLVFGLFALRHVDAARMIGLTTPFIAYISFTMHGVFTGQQSAQGAFIYAIFYGIVLTGVWGTD